MNLSLIDVCYEQIEDQYWFGLFGDFRLIIDRSTGCFNATKLCREGGKKISNWLQNKESKKLIDYYGKKSDPFHSSCHMIEVKKGNKNENFNKVISGTYLPKELILSLALWISHDFYDKVYKIIESYFVNEFIAKYKNDNSELNNKLKEIRIEMEHLRLEKEKYQDLEEDIVPKTLNANKHHIFALVNLNPPSMAYPYLAIRCQKLNYQNSLNRLKQKHPNLEKKFELKYDPNSINLFNRIKEQLKNINTLYNRIHLFDNYSEELFINDIKRIAKSKIARQ
ncbi:Putative KilA-N domain-containing protein 006L [Araneus ventricosus]|uniref:KilA-N domain-containing protein 006L n=1 Tax=Araneus ventricosus TaxID=182803 RepID=A0A4Y2G4D2_ARAVE|nr:Putative KilA-N domain-containing protein 006L [Araneus ventricosus]GBM48473.1 Putative KilA-N domain-containing protein 006L [Araneus ventricosus]